MSNRDRTTDEETEAADAEFDAMHQENIKRALAAMCAGGSAEADAARRCAWEANVRLMCEARGWPLPKDLSNPDAPE